MSLLTTVEITDVASKLTSSQNVSMYMLINLSITFILKILYLVIIDASGTVTENG